MLDVRDYKAQIRPDGESLGQISPFNVITEDLMLRNFTEAEVAALYAQHTEATGQVFEPAALSKVWEFTRGQPWLVNALSGKDLKAETDVLAFKVFKALGLFCFDGAKWNFANSIYAASWERRSSR